MKSVLVVGSGTKLKLSKLPEMGCVGGSVKWLETAREMEPLASIESVARTGPHAALLGPCG